MCFLGKFLTWSDVLCCGGKVNFVDNEHQMNNDIFLVSKEKFFNTISIAKV